MKLGRLLGWGCRSGAEVVDAVGRKGRGDRLQGALEAMGVQAVASEAVGVRGGRAEEKGMRAAMVVQEAAKVGLAVAEGRGAATVMPQR